MGPASAALRKGSEGTAPLSNRLRSLSASVALQIAALAPQCPHSHMKTSDLTRADSHASLSRLVLFGRTFDDVEARSQRQHNTQSQPA